MRVRPSPALPFILVLLARSAAAFEPLGNLSPDQALAAFETEPGFAVELVASEPLVVDPVALAFDDRGRLYVAENRDYPVGAPDGSPQGTIALLEDRDHDGRMDTRHDFASGIAFPNGVMCWRGGVIVTAAPEVFWLSDTNGDGRADLQETWLTGFDTNASSQLRANDPTLGPDGWIYFAGGLRGGKIRVPGSSAEVLDTEKGDLKFHPDSRRLELVTGKSQFGLAFDDAGNRFACMNRVQVQHAPIEARYLARNPILPSPGTLQNCPDITENVLLPQYSAGASRYFPISDNVTTADSHTGTYSAACAVHIYRGTLLPAEYQGAAFSCDPTGNLVRGDRLRKAGGTFRAERIHQGSEALRSRDNWFRPVFIADGPDGALYVADMYRKTIEHPEYLPGDLRKQTDFESGKGMGRIWRLRGDPLPRRLSPNLNDTSAAGLVRALDSPVPWVRDTAFRLLVEHGDRRVSRRLRNAIRPQAQTGPTVAKLRLLQLFQPNATDALLLALSHPAPAVRQNAALLAEPHLVQEPALFQALLVRATDPDPHVRHQAALSLGEVNDARVIPALVEVGARQASDRWSRAALLSALSDRTRLESFLHQLPEPTANLENLIPLASDLGRLLALQSPDTTNLALAAATRRLAASPAHRPVLVAFLSGFAETAKSSLSSPPTRSMRHGATPVIPPLFLPSDWPRSVFWRSTPLPKPPRSCSTGWQPPSPSKSNPPRRAACSSTHAPKSRPNGWHPQPGIATRRRYVKP